jgi:fumarate reductase (CoM/CoB) subunit A
VHKINTDVLIIGAGAAGIRAALAASGAGAEVLMVAKGPPTASGSTFSPLSKGWGIQALVDREGTDKNIEIFFEDIIRVGLGRCDPKLAHILAEDSGARFQDLLSYGLRFRQDSQGNHLRVPGCFSRVNRAFITEDYANLKDTFQTMLKKSRSRLIQGQSLDLIVSDGMCWGGWVLSTATKDILEVQSKATILATGGGAAIFTDHFAPSHQAGDGYTLAHRAGAEIDNMEFIQFMIGVKGDNSMSFMPLTSLKTGILQAGQSRDLLRKRIPDSNIRKGAVNNRLLHFPFSCRDSSYLIDKTIADENKQNNPVLWASKKGGPIFEVVHLVHAFNGGIRINEKAATSIPGLFATGEVAAGPHGADRIGGCMMTATQVFGERAGRYAAQHAKKTKQYHDINDKTSIFKLRKKTPDQNSSLNRLKKDARATISKHVMILRNQEGLIRCRKNLRQIQHEADTFGWWDMKDMSDFFSLRSILTVGRLVADSALANPVSIGSHFRTDSPAKSIVS